MHIDKSNSLRHYIDAQDLYSRIVDFFCDFNPDISENSPEAYLPALAYL